MLKDWWWENQDTLSSHFTEHRKGSPKIPFLCSDGKKRFNHKKRKEETLRSYKTFADVILALLRSVLVWNVSSVLNKRVKYLVFTVKVFVKHKVIASLLKHWKNTSWMNLAPLLLVRFYFTQKTSSSLFQQTVLLFIYSPFAECFQILTNILRLPM